MTGEVALPLFALGAVVCGLCVGLVLLRWRMDDMIERLDTQIVLIKRWCNAHESADGDQDLALAELKGEQDRIADAIRQLR